MHDSEGTLRGSGQHSDERMARVALAAKSWANQLIDLGGQNRLLYYRDLKLGTLDLGGSNAAHGAALATLFGGSQTTLWRLFPDPEQQKEQARRIRALYAKAQENREERGLATLFLAGGMASWDNTGKGSAIPAAPLVLWSLTLTPSSAARENFELKLEGEPDLNPVLLHFLRSEYGVEVDAAELLRTSAGEGSEVKFGVLYRLFEQSAKAVPAFRIDDRKIIGNFSYSKLPMVQDLENLAALVNHELIAGLAGDRLALEALAGTKSGIAKSMPNQIQPADEYLILDADASQNFAINAVVDGENLIIQGPPGTGKSQTIANLIATCVARGKKVLFVAEKRAAIDAVLKNLDKVGLNNLVMDLHGGVKSRRQLAQDLAETLNHIGSVLEPDVAEQHRNLSNSRHELLEYDEALHSKRAPWDVSVFDIQSALLLLGGKAHSNVRLSRAQLELLVPGVLSDVRSALQEFVELGGLRPAAERGPWAKSRIVTQDDARQALEFARRSKEAIASAAQPLRTMLDAAGLGLPVNVSEWAATLDLLDDVNDLAKTFAAGIYTQDLVSLMAALAPSRRSAFVGLYCRMTSGRYRRARTTVRGLTNASLRLTDGLLLDGAERAFAISRSWAEKSTDGRGPRSVDNLEAVTSYQILSEQLRALGAYLASEDIFAVPIVNAGSQLADLVDDTKTLFRLPKLRRLEGELRAWGLGPVLVDLASVKLGSEECLAGLDFVWYSSLHEQLALTDARIGSFDASVHSRNAKQFRSLDRRHIGDSAARVKRVAAERAIRARDAYPEENRVLEAQAKRKRGHLPFRELFAQTSNLLPAVKPCWAMSPLLVSQLLPSDRQYFDLAIFDEASQVRPAEAVPSIMRARQVVVAGDAKQLPPTSFFASMTAEDDAEYGSSGMDLTTGYESVLDVLGAVLRPFTLSWHYRSEDERLIAFSNAHLYDRSLTTFPGVAIGGCVDHHLVPTSPLRSDSSASSDEEVAKVVDLVMSHAERTPELTLGVIAMGIKHANRIDDALRVAQKSRDDATGFFDDRREERFFVKNIERVQGDERDCIILSVGYGKDAEGRLKYRFGPLLQEGGERRLNVAITRARKQMALVSSFDATDMDPSKSTARAVDLLRQYFVYASSGGNDLGAVAKDIPKLNPFEISVRDRLASAGMPLVPQHGASGYKIDFAASHPQKPGLFVLAIECDGASYHSSATARDRDRLRQDVLERLGWKFHRIWSTAWFQNPELEAKRAIAAWHQACMDYDGLPDDSDASVPVPDQLDRLGNSNAEGPRKRGRRPRVQGRASGVQYTNRELVDLVEWIKSDGLLRTEEKIVDEMISVLGFKRRSDRIVTAIRTAIRSSG